MMVKVAVALSVLINAILIGYVIGYVELLLFIAILVIIGLSWFIRRMINYYKDITTDLSNILEEMVGFENHAKGIYEMEMFYGDETLNNMIIHMSRLIDEMSDYREKYIIEEEEEDGSEGSEEAPEAQEQE